MLYSVNCGDSGVVVGNSEGGRLLSVMHNMDNDDEVMRVGKANIMLGRLGGVALVT